MHDELASLIERALRLADKNQLHHVGIKLDEARLALLSEHASCIPSALFDELVSVLPTSLPIPVENTGENVINLRGKSSLEQLFREHSAIDIRREYLIELAKGPPSPMVAERQLEELRRFIQAHRLSERRCVYVPLITMGIDAAEVFNARIKNLIGEMEVEWDGYLNRWDREKISEHWPEFAVATQTILNRVGERMRTEEKVIYPLAFLAGLVYKIN